MRLAKYIYKIVGIFFLLICLNFQAIGQESTVTFSGKVEKKDIKTGKTYGKMSNVKVVLYKNGQPYQNVTTSSNGKYEIEVEAGPKYKIIFTQPGFVSKFVEMDTRAVKESLNDEKMNVDMTLFEEVPGVNFSLLKDNPIGRGSYNPENPQQSWDYEYTTQMRVKIQALLKKAQDQQDENEKKFKELVKSGDSNASSKAFDDAITDYKAALEIKKDQVVESKLAKAIADKKKSNDAGAKKKQYEAVIAAADNLFNSKSWDASKAKYQEAIKILPTEAYPKQRIAEIEQLMKDQLEEKQNAEKYQKLIKKAEGELAAGDLKVAKRSFLEASALKSSEKYPKDKIKEIEALLKEKEAEGEKQADYDKAIAQATKELNGGKLELAKESYQKALGILPNEKFPKDKIAEIEKLLADQQKENEAANKKKEYDRLINQADGQFSSDDFDNAKGNYQKALKVFPNEQYPKDQIAAIAAKQKALADQAQKDATDKAEAEKRKKYDQLVKSGNGAMTSEKYKSAKTNFEDAANLYPTEALPKQKIAEILAKLKEITDRQGKEDRYKELITSADGSFSGKEYLKAKSTYEEALGVKDDPYPKAQIAKIDALIRDENSKQAEDDAYKQLIASADVKLNADALQDAKRLYQQAIGKRSNDPYPKQKIAEIEQRLLNKTKALADADKESKYKKLIQEADTKFEKPDLKNLEDAKKLYKQAYALINEKYPEDQIKKINQRITDLNEEEVKKGQYAKILKIADLKFSEKAYIESKGLYERAVGIRPTDQYPKDQIAEIERLLKVQKDAMAEGEINNKFKKLLDEGDRFFGQSQWEAAIGKYQEALSLKDDDYAKRKIEQAKAQMQLEEIAKKNAEYKDIIFNADNSFDSKNYAQAKGLYEQALGVKPNEGYPKDRLKEIELRLKQFEDIARNEEDAKNNEYQKVLDLANQQFDAKTYQNALASYQKAATLRPDQAFPRRRIKEILDLLKRIKEEEERQEQIVNEQPTSLPIEEVSSNPVVTSAIPENKLKPEEDSEPWYMDESQYGIEVDNENIKDALTLLKDGLLEVEAKKSINVDNLHDERIANTILHTKENQDELFRTKDYNENNLDLISDFNKVGNEHFIENYDSLIPKENDRVEFYTTESGDQLEKIYTDINQVDKDIEARARVFDEADQRREDFEVEVVNFGDSISYRTASWDDGSVDDIYLALNENETHIEEVTIQLKEYLALRGDALDEVLIFEDSVSRLTRQMTNEAIDRNFSNRDSVLDLNETIVDFIERKNRIATNDAHDVRVESESLIDTISMHWKKYKENERITEDKIIGLNDTTQLWLKERNDKDYSALVDFSLEVEELASRKLKKFEPLYKNKLAQDYKQGVTSKVFKKQDQYGNVIEINVVRIVVRGNIGDHYLFTKNKYGEGYYKNGVAITESIWEDETNLIATNN